MATLWRQHRSNPSRFVARGECSRSFEKSRDRWKVKYTALQERIKAFRTEIRDLRRARDRWQSKAEEFKRQLDELRAEMPTPAEQSPPCAELIEIARPDPAFELTPAGHQFCLVQIVLMLGWVLCGISLRGTCNILACLFEMDVEWGFEFPVPHFTTVRLWLLRLGHYNLTRAKEHADDWVWVIDHSNQIGQEKCLVILGVRLRNCLHRVKSFRSACPRWNRSNWSPSSCRTRRWSTGS